MISLTFTNELNSVAYTITVLRS